ncbi:Nucleoid occlusion protein [subsurface metagenome]
MGETRLLIEMNRITCGENPGRLDFDDDEIDDLAVSIGRIGMINPIIVRKKDDDFVIIAGHRRFTAASKCGMEKIPCYVHEGKETETTEITIAENLFRTDLTPVETACMVHDIINNDIMSLEQVAASMHRSRHWVKSQVDLLAWPGDVLEIVHQGKLSVSAAANLALIEDPTYRAYLMRNAVESGATARTTAAWLQAWRSMAPPEEALQADPLPGGSAVSPAVPQAPCLCCGDIKRTDALATVLMCPQCIGAIRTAEGR